MAFKTILKVEGDEREILEFNIDYFTAEIYQIHKWNGNRSYEFLDEAFRSAFKGKSSNGRKGAMFGGLFDITLESTDDDDFIYYWFLPIKDSGATKIKHGVLEFFNGSDEDIPFRRLEFWDAWVSQISERHSSTGSKPMVIQMTVSPATVRYNRTVVFQQSWWQTDINYKGGKASVEEEEQTPQITKLCWKDADGKEIIDVFPQEETVTLYAETKNVEEGEEVTFTVLDLEEKEETVSAQVGKNGIIQIDYKTKKTEA